MTFRMFYRVAVGLFLAGGAILFPGVGLNQSQPADRQSQSSQDDVIRVNVELVQTDVTVFDKKGRFVDQLTANDFELTVDGKPQEIAFFERVVFENPANNERGAPDPARETTAAAAARARTVLFFVDDLHLSATSLAQTRKALLDFVHHGMGAKDQVAITSASGQIGFLQQFTGDRTVLQSAVARLNYRANAKFDTERPPMSEFIAARIQDGDESTISYYVAEMMKQNCFRAGGEQICMIDTQGARHLVIQRAREITLKNSPDTKNTLIMLEGLMRTAAQLPGRKLMFLISDGFYLNDRQTGSRDRIKKITEAAGRAGVVIYTLDARGIVSEGLDATNDRPIDSEGLTMSGARGDIAASQEGLNALARDTGGQAFRNTNRPMAEWVKQVVDENSTYYVLAWRPLSDEQKSRGFKNLRINIKGRPELTARMRRGYFRTTPLPMLSVKGKSEKGVSPRENDMRLVIDAPVAGREIKANLSVSMAPMPGVGTRVIATVAIDRAGLAFDLYDGKPAADVDIGGIVYDDKGKPKTSFVGRLRIAGADSSQMNAPAVYRFQAWLPAGLYQVRVGLRDTRSGKTGNAEQWIKVLVP